MCIKRIKNCIFGASDKEKILSAHQTLVKNNYYAKNIKLLFTILQRNKKIPQTK